MARVILVYGQPASGKTFALRNLDAETTCIIDADAKHALPWRGWKKFYGSDKKNFFAIDDIATIIKWIDIIGNPDKQSKIRTLVIDGLNTAMNFGKYFNPDRSYQGWAELGKSILEIVRHAKNVRDNLDVIINAHVEVADPNNPNAVDRIKTPGKMVSDVGIESLLLYVFYAKTVDGKYFFETQPNRSSARTPEGCFEPQIPNDMKFILDTINAYEQGE
ncbi:MAG: AAA family ATPase [Selenomonadaceae bacterium]|nr:AAA family ATPase [Selenomonadaceae bacterium]MBR4384184.1 AAA family ATPase [Selenomonadaceae bacterium]